MKARIIHSFMKTMVVIGFIIAFVFMAGILWISAGPVVTVTILFLIAIIVLFIGFLKNWI